MPGRAVLPAQGKAGGRANYGSMRTATAAALALCLLAAGEHAPAAGARARNPHPQGRPKVERLILDTDIGTDIDDAYALAFILGCPELELVGVTTAYGPTERRARLARALLEAAGRPEIPVYVGRRGNGNPDEVSGQLDWGDRHASRPPEREEAVAWLVRTIMEAPGEISLLAIGPLPNIGAALAAEPQIARKVRRFVLMAGSVRKGYASPTPVAEYNIHCDIAAAQAVFSAPWMPLVVPLDVTMPMVLDAERRRAIAARERPLCRALTELYAAWAPRDPILHDPLAAAVMLRPELVEMEALRLVVDDEGYTRESGGLPNARVALRTRPEPFLEFYLSRVCGAR